MKILIIGTTGMLGNAMIRILSEKVNWQVFGTARSESAKHLVKPDIAERLITNIDVEQCDKLIKVFAQIKPNIVINCIGLIKQKNNSEDHVQAILLNALFPHRLARLCEMVGARLIHIGTDCVFQGDKGNYRESDKPDANDLYGKSKSLGDVTYSHTITLRTSIIGHELQTAHGLVDWFLSQKNQCRGYTKAIFSGLPTVVLAQVIRDCVIPHPELSGIYHVASNPISKYDLLKSIASLYKKEINIVPDDSIVIDRSLNSKLFCEKTGYIAPEWPSLIKTMYLYK